MTTRKLIKRNMPILPALILLLLFASEILLRVTNFRYEWDAEFAYPRPADFANLRYDPDLFWTLNPDDPDVNTWGFRGDEITVEKTTDAYRILIIGDSITEAGYPREVEKCLHTAGFTQVEVLPLAAGGYSSYQGRVIAEKYGLLLSPDLVIVQFGWNDHWRAVGEPDAEKTFPAPSVGIRAFHRVYDRVRVLQALGWVWGVGMGQGNTWSDQVRVPLEAYVANLTAIRALFEQENIPVRFVTAPSAQALVGVPADLIQRGFATSAESVIQLHETYNARVRTMPGVIDLAAEIEKLGAGKRALFQLDGIHPTPAGTEVFGQVVCDEIKLSLP